MPDDQRNVIQWRDVYRDLNQVQLSVLEIAHREALSMDALLRGEVGADVGLDSLGNDSEAVALAMQQAINQLTQAMAVLKALSAVIHDAQAEIVSNMK